MTIFLHGEQYPTTTKFHSRNFANIKQANTFAKASLERFSNFHQKSSKIHEDTREKRETLTRPSSKSAGGITIESRYGPVGLNNPSALLANKSYPWDQGRFRAIRIGPPSLPTFPIPALPPNPTSNTSVITELGPHRQLRPKGQHPKAVVLPTVATTNQASSQKLPKATRIPWSSKGTKSTKIRKITTSTPVVVVDSGNKLSNDKPFMFKKRAKIRPKIAPTKASISRKNFNMVRSNEVPTDATRAPVISDKPVNTLSNRKNAATSKWTLPNSNTKDSTLTVDVSGIREAKPMRATLLSNGSGRVIPGGKYFKASNNATTIYQIEKQVLTISDEAEMGNNFCWETMIGQPEYGEFKVAENVLHIINNQGMVWLGLFFAPLLPALNNLKLIILMYIRGWACMTCNVPAREIFRASRILCGYSNELYGIYCNRNSNDGVTAIEGRLDRKVMGWLRYLASPGVVIPVLLLLMLIIYFLVSLVRGLQKKNSDLQQQLIHERTEEKKKIFELAGTAQRKNSEKNREKKKQAITYLPLIEQKRREPWRSCNSQDYDSSLCVTDKSSTMTSPDSGQSFSPKNRSRRQLLPRKSIQQESTKILQPVPQQFIRKDSTEQSTGGNGEESNGLFSPPTTGRSNDWLKQDDSEDSELQPYSIESGVIEEATSEEVRNLMRRLTKSMHGSAVSLVVSSKHHPFCTHNSLTVLFPTSFASRDECRSALGQYYLTSSSPYDDEFTNSASYGNIHRLANSSLFTKPSLSQLAVPEPKTNKKAVSSPPQLNLPETHQLSSTSESHISTSQLLFPPTISNDESTINGAATNGTESNIPLIADTQTEKPKISTPLRKATSIEDRGEQEFAPWQSAKQTQSQISGFSKRQQESKNGFGNDQPSKSMSSCMKSENLEDSPPAFQQHHQRRFRISVSPTRRFQSQSGPSGSDTDTSTGKRRYVIRQEIFPDLTLSGSMNDSGISHRKSSVHSSHAAEIHNGKDN
ncbi:unnamed protein product [Litomosoides sigmodontis]|uniref:TMC domain-containing protein n=1 Tax=Litomosoides sigmodontis TaxID=42156 RepID=A0A3P6V343_LITSI|nr:unnamed protein product [Litomosoides sigmodontis]